MRDALIIIWLLFGACNLFIALTTKDVEWGTTFGQKAVMFAIYLWCGPIITFHMTKEWIKERKRNDE